MGKGADMTVPEREGELLDDRVIMNKDSTSDDHGADKQATRGKSREREAWLPSFLFWCWMTELIKSGCKKPLQAEDLYDLNENESTQWCAQKWDQAWAQGGKDTPSGPSVLRCLQRAFQGELFLAALWKPLWLCTVVLQVYILKGLVKVAMEAEPFRWWWGLLLVVGMLLTSILQSLCQGHTILQCQKVGMKVRAAVSVAVYKKALAMNTAAMSPGASQGRMLNLVTNDTQKLLDAITLIHFVWHPVIELVVICGLALLEAGVAALGGVLVVLLVQPVQILMARRVGSIRRIAVQYTDARIRLVGELLSGVRVVKYSGWTSAFLTRLDALRVEELKWIGRASYVRSANSTIKDIATPLASLATFGLYVALHDGNLSPSKAFTVLALFSIMVRIFTITPQGLQFLEEALVAIRRLQSFLHLPEGKGCCNADEVEKVRQKWPTAAVAVETASFAWPNVGELGPVLEVRDKQRRRRARKWINFRGTAQINLPTSESIHGSIATHRVSSNKNEEDRGQKAGLDFATGGGDEGIQTREVAFSVEDIDLVVGKQEMVAVTGVVGSGKSSLLLALLSEMEHIKGAFALSGRVAYAPQQPWIFNGTVRENITFGAPLDMDFYLKTISACALDRDLAALPAGDQTEIGERGVNLSGGQKSRIGLARACYSRADIVLLDDPLAAVDVPTACHLMNNVLSSLLLNRSVILVTHTRSALACCSRVLVMEGGRIARSIATDEIATLTEEIEDGGGIQKLEDEGLRQGHEEQSGLQNRRKDETSEGALAGKVTVIEDRVTGNVRWATFLDYLRAAGGIMAFCLLILFFMFAQSIRTGVDYWLGVWVDRKYHMKAGAYVAVYGGLTLAAGVFSLLRALLFTRMAVRAARTMHRQMAVAVLRSPQRFFDQNPVGRIVNRFSKDQSLVDELLPGTAQVTLELYLSVGASLVIISVLVPWVLILLPPSAVVFIFLQKRYVKVSRELKRLDGLSRSPIFTHFSQTIAGISTVRACGAKDRFLQHYISLIDANHRAYILFAHAGRWLGVRLDSVAGCIVAATALSVVLLRNALPPGIAGVVLVQSLQITGLFAYATRQAAETENYFTSVERIRAYMQLPTEAEPNTPPGVISADWPEKGEIVVENFTMAYRVELPPVLNDLNFKIAAQEKVGILGRTGAGKSSLAAVLFRMVENNACHGRVLIDGVDIRNVGLDDLRQRLSIIPQDPVLFHGTVRQNLDPFNRATDAEITAALQRVHLQAKISSLEGGLDSQVSDNGENLSLGQCQLLCLARALLRRSRIILMDEATAAVDSDTDQLIQETMRESFRTCTVLTIAHRIETIIDCDRVLVLAMGGRIAEFDSPAQLLERGDDEGVFASMVAQSGEEVANKLRRAAKEASRRKAQNKEGVDS